MAHKALLLFSVFLLSMLSTHATTHSDTLQSHSNAYQFSATKLIIPAIGIGYGVGSLTIGKLERVNIQWRSYVQQHLPYPSKIDNGLQFAPVVTVYGLNFLGIKGKHKLLDLTVIYAMTQIVSAALVLPTKHTVREKRPDATGTTSFPSGHTVTAFSAAHLMFREYKDKNLWLGMVGYPFAFATGIMRTVNNRHWLGDVVAGAGIGILSTEIAYWLFPYVSKKLHTNKGISLIPLYNHNQPGVGLGFVF